MAGTVSVPCGRWIGLVSLDRWMQAFAEHSPELSRKDVVVLLISELALYSDVSFEEAAATWPDGGELLCQECGWTLRMVCPVCPLGCGCSTTCWGPRHGDL